MTSVDDVVAGLSKLPAAERTGVEVVHELRGLDTPGTRPPPAWFAVAVGRAIEWLSTAWFMSSVFERIRFLEQIGSVTLARDDAYVLAMVSGLGDRWAPEPRLDAIRTDAELRDELLWRVFEVEGGGEVSLANVDRFSRPEATWAECFRVLVADGTLPRERVLSSCLRALGRDFNGYRAGFFSKLYVSLEPTTAELIAGEAQLLRLLGATVPATVAFAVRYLTMVDRSGRLDDEAFVVACPPALVVPAKTTPLAVLRLLGTIAGRRPELAVAAAAATGLEHRHAEVQLAALALIGDDQLADRLDLLEPSVAQAARTRLGVSVAVFSPGASETSEDQSSDRTAGERAAAVLAGETDPWQLELLLATIAAEEAVDELAALAKPARRALRDPWLVRHAVAALLLGDKLESAPGFLTGRLAEIRARTGPRTLLATPSDRTGRLDPTVLVTRLTAQPEPWRFDLIAALLRLHPDRREQARHAARDLTGDAGAAVRYALGGAAAPIGDPALWVAAARCRAPLDDDPHLIAAGLGGAGQGHAARYTLRVDPHTERYVQRMVVGDDGPRPEYRASTTWRPFLDVHPAAANPAAERPTVRAAGQLLDTAPDYGHGGLGGEWTRWAAWIWAHDAEPFLADEMPAALECSYWADDGRTAAILEAIVAHPGRLGTFAASVVAAGLTAHEGAVRIRAAEVLTMLVPDRIDTATMVAAMANLSGHATATRWAGALRNTGRPDLVTGILGKLLPELPHHHPGVHALLGTVREESVRAQTAPHGEALRAWLLGFAGSSKAAKTARQLLAAMS